MFKSICTLILLASIQLQVHAQEKRKSDLHPGDVAPPLSIMKWVKGDPIPPKFEKGKFYLVEFSSLYCPPCFKMIPHMRELTQAFAGKLTVISIFDPFMSSTTPGYMGEMDKFLQTQKDNINYAVAVDMPKMATASAWLSHFSMPDAFLVDGKGKIAWHGYPWFLTDRLITSVLNKKPHQTVATPRRGAFQDTVDGRHTDLYYIKRGNIHAAISDYGARLVYLQVPGKSGSPVSIVDGFDSLSAYRAGWEDFTGATLGRVEGRLSTVRFVLDGKETSLISNYGDSSLIHGGTTGFQNKVWDARQVDEATLELTHLSPDGDGGFPGNLQIKVTYSIEKDQTLKVTYDATTDKPTIVNMSNHILFNLNGEGKGLVTNHLLAIHADKFTPLVEHKFAKGTIASVEGTPLDFRKPMTVGMHIDDSIEQMKTADGYEHNFVLNQQSKDANGLIPALKITGDKTGITMTVSTSEPCITFCSWNTGSGMEMLRSGAWDERRTAFLVQPGNFPDAPNQPAFPSIELRPGEKYHSESRFTFSNK